MGIHAQAEAGNGVFVAEKTGISIPMAFDLEQDIIRFYRLEGSIFPLHIILDPEGNVAHIDNNFDLEVLKGALEELLPER